MGKRDSVEDRKSRYPEEADEPLHTCLFRSERFKIYCAVIPPGVETAYHRHSEDALAVVVDGGRLSSHTIGPRRISRYLFPGPAGRLQKLWRGVCSLVTGAMCLRAGAFFATMNKGFPMVHKVSASAKNAAALKLMSIQLFPPGRSAPGPLHVIPEEGKRRLATDKFFVYSVTVKPGDSVKLFRSTPPALVVSLGDGLRLIGGTSRVDWSVELGRGQFHLLESSECLRLSCTAHLPSQALLLIFR